MTEPVAAMAETVHRVHTSGDWNILLEAIPYARLLGIRVDGKGRFHLPPKASNIGNPPLPALHGGALGCFMEMSGILQVMMAMDVIKVPKVVDFSIDYVRAGLYRDTWAHCEIIRFGRKLVNVNIDAWQDDRQKLIAHARAQVLVD